MSNFIVIFLCLAAGVLCKRLRYFPGNSAQSVNAFIIYLSLPALILSQIPKMVGTSLFQGAWYVPVSMAWCSFALSFLIFSFLGKHYGWSKPKTGALILTAGLGNTSFVGFPLLEALIGPHAIPLGILVDQPGSFLALSTLGIIVAASFSGGKVSASSIARRVFTFPPMIALLFAVMWGALNHPAGELLFPVFEKIATTLVPLALFAVGFQLRLDWSVIKKRWRPLMFGLGFKLILFPALMALFYIRVLGGHDLATQVTVIEAAMASMITSAVVATDFHLDSEIANLMVGLSIPLSLVTVPLWFHWLY